MKHLQNKTIVVTRAEEQSQETINFFKNIGANLISFPSLEVIPVDASAELKTLLEESTIDYLVFQSENAIKYFVQLVKENNLNIDYAKIRVACHGRKTVAACLENHITVDLLPDDLSTVGLLKLFSQEPLENKVILLPFSADGKYELSDSLKKFGATVKSIAVYDIQIPKKETVTEEIEKIRTSTVDWYLFISPEAYQNFLKLFDIVDPKEFFSNSKIAAIGRPTKIAIEETDVKVDVVPKKHAVTHAIASIEKYYTDPKPKIPAKPKQRLKNKTIVLTRAEEQSQETINFFNKKEAHLISFPALEVVAIDASEKLTSILEEKKIDYLVFQSANAIKYFVKLVKEKNLPIDYSTMKVACVGKKTAAFCLENLIKVDLVPEDFSALGLLKLFAIEPLENKTVLLPRSAIGRDEFREGLKRFGATVKTVAVYDIRIPEKETVAEEIEKIRTSKISWYLFTSPSTYHNFLALMDISNPRDFFKSSKIAAIGPTTKEAIEKTRVHVDVVPGKFAVTHAIASIEKYCSAPPPKLPKLKPPEKKVIRYVLKKRKPKNEN